MVAVLLHTAANEAERGQSILEQRPNISRLIYFSGELKRDIAIETLEDLSRSLLLGAAYAAHEVLPQRLGEDSVGLRARDGIHDLASEPVRALDHVLGKLLHV